MVRRISISDEQLDILKKFNEKVELPVSDYNKLLKHLIDSGISIHEAEAYLDKLTYKKMENIIESGEMVLGKVD